MNKTHLLYHHIALLAKTFSHWLEGHSSFSTLAVAGASSFLYRLRHIKSHDELFHLYFSLLGIAHHNGRMWERLGGLYTVNGVTHEFSYHDLNTLRNTGILEYYGREAIDFARCVPIQHFAYLWRKAWRDRASYPYGDEPYGYFEEKRCHFGRDFALSGNIAYTWEELKATGGSGWTRVDGSYDVDDKWVSYNPSWSSSGSGKQCSWSSNGSSY